MGSYHSYEVYGSGHLADVLRVQLSSCGLQNLLSGIMEPSFDFAFAAEDVVDHGELGCAEAVFGDALARVSGGHVALVSQVPPGTTRTWAGNQAHRVFYQVDTIIVSRAVQRMLRPEQIIVGCADPSAPLPLAYQEYLAAFTCPVLTMSYESAELAKCMINVALARQVELAHLGSRAAADVGADWEDVARALRGDARIGPHAYLVPGQLNQHLRRDVATVARLVEEGE